MAKFTKSKADICKQISRIYAAHKDHRLYDKAQGLAIRYNYNMSESAVNSDLHRQYMACLYPSGIVRPTDKEKADALCTKCPGSLKNKPVEGLQILSGLKADGNNQWSDCKLVDPESGKTYSGKLTLSDNGQSLKLRGFVGTPVFGRSQTWQRIK